MTDKIMNKKYIAREKYLKHIKPSVNKDITEILSEQGCVGKTYLMSNNKLRYFLYNFEYLCKEYYYWLGKPYFFNTFTSLPTDNAYF